MTAEDSRSAKEPKPAAVVAWVLLAGLGGAVACGGAFSLWVQTLSFGGPGDSQPSGGEIGLHIVIIGLGLVGAGVAAKTLLGGISSHWVVLLIVVVALVSATVVALSLAGIRI